MFNVSQFWLFLTFFKAFRWKRANTQIVLLFYMFYYFLATYRNISVPFCVVTVIIILLYADISIVRDNFLKRAN